MQLGRKKYVINAAIANLEETIIGWDFIKKYRLSFYWDENGECYLYDRKAQVKKHLEFISVPHQSRPHLSRIDKNSEECVEGATVLFDTAAMQVCDNSVSDKPEPAKSESAKTVHIPNEYQTLLNRFPNLMVSYDHRRPKDSF